MCEKEEYTTLKEQRLLTLVALCVLAISLYGCGNATDDGKKEKKTQETKDGYAASLDDTATNLSKETYTFGQVAIGGGGFVSGLITTPSEENLIYARTDVGGAYRWMEDTKTWKSLSYGISEKDVGYLSVDGIAIDPSSPGTLYMVCGCSYFSNGRTAIMISTDYGETFETVDVTEYIKVHGNGMGRQNGERIAVDPGDGTVYVGGRSGGLIRSRDGGKSWEKVSSFTPPVTQNDNGICSIVIDSKSTLYVACSLTGKNNIFVSTDKGQSFTPLEGLPTDWMPARMHLDADENLLISYGDMEGPWNGTKGGLCRYDTNKKKAQDISPKDGCPMGDVQADPKNPRRLIASTINTWKQQPNGAWGDIFYVSDDGGKSWDNILEKMTMDNNGVPWITDYAIHWCGSLILDPFREGRLFVTSGNGVFACDDIWADKPAFYFNAKGIEENVALDLISVPGGAVYSALGDYSGYIHTDIHQSGQIYEYAEGSNYSICYAAKDPSQMVRINSAKGNCIYQSKDGGQTWGQLRLTPKLEGDTPVNGVCAITADGKRIFWSPSNGKNSYYTDDDGESWNTCVGIANDAYIIADPNKPDYVYACSGHIFYVSTDGGKNFKSKYFTLDGYKRICLPPDEEGTIYLPGGKQGLAVSTDYGESFTVMENVALCCAVGVGKAATDDRPMVIYMYGSMKDAVDQPGIFASEDAGKTWLRINDDSTQFGGPGNGQFVVGDMNTYGTVYMSTVGLGIVYGELESAR